MSKREDWPKSLPDEVEFIADDAPLNPHEQAVLRRAAALLREQEREPDAWIPRFAVENWRSGRYGGYLKVFRHREEDNVPVYFATPPTSTSEGDEGSFGGVSLLNSLVRLGRGALEMEFGLTANGEVGVWWTRGIEDAPDAVGDTVDEALYRLLAAPPETENEDHDD